VIASGGIKVSLDSVEEILGQIPGVQEVVAVAISDPEWGERVGIAFTGSPEVEVARHLEDSLGPAAKPVVVSHFADLPRLHTGKLDRLTIAQLLGNSI
jgi:O-succinylbenzoic acid--CoA ligase